jgi:cytoskeletal protein RodZ
MAQTLGKQLAQKREQDGMSVEDVAHRTRIPANVLRCLENDDYSHFPNIVYARSFLRMYSAHLDVDAGGFLKELREAAGAKPARSARSGPQYFSSQVTEAEIEEMTGMHLNLGWIPWRAMLSAIFFASVLGAGGYVVYQLWDEHQKQSVVESPSPESRTAEEKLIGGKSQGDERPVAEDPLSRGDEDNGSSPYSNVGGTSGDEEIVLRAVPVEPQPVPGPDPDSETISGEAPSEGEQTAEELAQPTVEGPQVSVGPNSADADAVAVSGPANRSGVAPAPVVSNPPSTENTN